MNEVTEIIKTVFVLYSFMGSQSSSSILSSLFGSTVLVLWVAAALLTTLRNPGAERMISNVQSVLAIFLYSLVEA